MKRLLVLACVPGLVASASGAERARPSLASAAPDWAESIRIDGYFSGGLAINFADPYNGINFGHLFTDRANSPQFNQAVLTLERPLDQKNTGFDYGFRLRAQFGSDVRYTQFLGETEYLIKARTQLSFIEAHALAHLPILTKGGVDVKVGQFVSLNGAETITGRDNVFYTLSFSSNFGPQLHTGVLTTTMATDWLNVLAGVTSGIDTSIGWPGDNNNSPSFLAGFNLTLLGGALDILGLSHAGPENPKMPDPLHVGWPNGVIGGVPAACACDPNKTWRFINSLTATWKATDRISFITDVSFFREDGWNPISVTGLPFETLDALARRYGFDAGVIPRRPQGADAYGVAQYATYRLNETVRLGGRLEFWRDNKNFFASASTANFDNANAQHGFPAPSSIAPPAGRGTSYLALTAGATITLPVEGGGPLSQVIMRPELRWDTAVNGTAPFFGANGPRRSQGLFSMDVLLPFSVK